jgi:YVTN family beta-propeller protein
MRVLAAAVVLVALFVTGGCGAGSVSGCDGCGPVPASVSGTIKVGTAPNAVAVDATNNKIYVTDYGTAPRLGVRGCLSSGSDIKVIDGLTQSTAPIDFTFFVGYATWTPYAVIVNPATHDLHVVANFFSPDIQYVCVFWYEAIESFDATTGTQCCNIATLRSVGGIDANFTTGNIYATDYAYGFVAVLPSGSGIPVATIPVGTSPLGIAFDAATNTIFVANSGSNNVSVIDGATDSVKTTIAVGIAPSGVAVDSQTNYIYVANAGNSQSGNAGNITVIDGATSATQTLTDQNATNPGAVAVNPTTNKIYVANSGSNNVTVINGAHD